MEIQKENHLLEQFEKTKTFKRFFSTLLRFDEELDCFIATEKWRDKEAELLTAAWWMFAEVSKAQSAPESFEQAYSEIFSPIIKRPYPRLVNGDYKYSEIDQGWKLWRAATAQAVPEWAVIVPKLSANYLFNTVPELGFEHQDQKDTVLYHLNYMASEFRDSAKQFVEDDHAKQKTMIEAQEPAND